MMGRYIPVITYHCGWYYLSSNAGAYPTYAKANQDRIKWMKRK